LILVLQNGIIVEQGTHESLVSAEGTYAKLVSLQTVETSI
jgi:ABC-type multidrug transport system fused ATPase/permease subunit